MASHFAVRLGAGLSFGGLLLSLAACNPFPQPQGATPQEAVVTGTDEWEERSLEVDGKTYLCIIKDEGYKSEELECDWEHPNPRSLPANIEPLAPPGDEEWELQYMETSTGQQLTCVVKLKRHTRSCQWSDS